MNIVEFAIRRRVTILMLTVALLLFGIVSLLRLKVDLLPDLSYPTLTVRTELPGSAPLEVENLITRPVEEAVGIIRNVRHVRSVSRSGQSDVTLEFAWGTDMDLAGIDVREKLDLLLLPLEAKRPLLLRFDPASEPVMRLALTDKASVTTADAAQARLRDLRRFAEDRLKPELESVEGSAAVKVSGGYEDEIQIQVDQQKLAQLGLSIETVTRRVRAENVNLSGGRLEQGTQRFLVRTLNEFQSIDQMANAIIATVGGRPVYLRDVASVTHGHKDREAITRVNGRECIELAVYKEGDANTVQLAGGVRKKLEQIEKAFPTQSEVVTVYDQSHFIAAAIGEVKFAAALGGLLAIVVLYLFLRDARTTLITSVAIPVSVVGTFMLMYMSDLSLNIMSLGGLALAVGMLVDNAVVVLEAIVRKREHGHSRAESAQMGTREVSTAVTAATLTSVAVFFPMVFISGIAGQLFKDQALTVTYSLLLSLAVALTLVPMLAAGGESANQSDEGAEPARPLGRISSAVSTALAALRRGAGAISRTMERLFRPAVNATQSLYSWCERMYPPAIRWALAHRIKVLGGALALFLVTMLIVPQLGSELVPQISQGEFNIDLRLAAGTPLEVTDQAVSRVQLASQQLPNLGLSYAVAGTGNRLDANPVDSGENTGRVSVTLGSGATRADEERAIDQLRKSLQQMPGVQHQFSRPSLFALSTPLEVIITGYDLDRLAQAAERVHTRMLATALFRDVRSTVEAGNPEIQIVFDQERATQLGLAVRDIADRVVQSVRGEVATRYRLNDKKIDVLVRSVDTHSASIEEIRRLIVNPGSERPVPLTAVADVTLASGPAEIRRIGQERVAIVSADVVGADLGTGVVALQGILKDTAMPAGVTAYISGQSEEMRDSFASLQLTLVLAVFLVYLVMASQFESLVHPFVILLTIPLAVIGAVWALWLTGTTVNVVAYIGLIMLAGIVVNQSIVLIDAVNQARERGLDKVDAIVAAGRARLRPILITKLTTILGLVPMAIGVGEGAELRAPMAITVIGGVTLTTFLTLLVIPVVYSVMDRKTYAATTVPAPASTGT
jgi:HAE1 family hydrophobic/amphiphilic exporter-1